MYDSCILAGRSRRHRSGQLLILRYIINTRTTALTSPQFHGMPNIPWQRFICRKLYNESFGHTISSSAVHKESGLLARTDITTCRWENSPAIMSHRVNRLINSVSVIHREGLVYPQLYYLVTLLVKSFLLIQTTSAYSNKLLHRINPE